MKTRRLAVLLATIAALAGCTIPASTGTHSSSAPKSSDSVTFSAPPSPKVSVKLVWTKIGKSQMGKEADYVARVTNTGGGPANVALSVKAYAKDGTIAGSDEPSVPTVPAGSSFDFFGQLGGTVLDDLTDMPAKLTVKLEPEGAGGAGGLLKTGTPKLKPGDPTFLFGWGRFAYDLRVKVTNSTGQDLTVPAVTQQVVLYDRRGRVVGGVSGSSDNVPDSLDAGESYREVITGVPAWKHATSVKYAVWLEG